MFTKQQLAQWREQGFEFDGFYDSVAVDKDINMAFELENAKPELKLTFISAKEEFLNYLITFSIETKNIKNQKGFLTLNDFNNNKIISSIEIELGDKNFSKQFSFVKSNLFSFEPQNVFAKLFSDGKTAESKKFKIERVKKIKKCFCNRDIDEYEMQEIVDGIRDNTFYSYNGKDYPISNLRKELFNRNNETYKDFKTEIVPINERTYKKLSSSLNNTFKTFNINTCIKKIHFLSQMTIETAYFTSTIELKNEKLTYDDFRGRGFLQLTHEGDIDNRTQNATSYLGYKLYSKNDVLTTPSLISKSIDLSSDSAGWFWVKGVRKIDGSTINLNLLCKDSYDNIEEITRLVKGAATELQERIDAFNILKLIFEYDKCKNEK